MRNVFFYNSLNKKDIHAPQPHVFAMFTEIAGKTQELVKQKSEKRTSRQKNMNMAVFRRPVRYFYRFFYSKNTTNILPNTSTDHR